MAISLLKSKRSDIQAAPAGKIKLFIDENEIVCKIDENKIISEVSLISEYASNAEVLAKTNTTKVITPATIDGGVKRFKALISQTGTNAPTVIISENTLGEVPTFSYLAPGLYTLNCVADIFTANKTHAFLGVNLSGSKSIVVLQRQSAKQFRLFSTDGTGAAANDVYVSTSILIEVYP